ncbi:helix-turn-helix domain-containing protein [Paenibacillus sp. OV219]|uniref:helix-turn-helix domain-containing protein n=1 Tax=Paenibacillus sp. OV219 TaxID=1884377 RepID=UPI0008C98718|nr:helix-turn-helix transcriptional regulator [Paenibacillus sp. OV219]SEO88127.1 Helix-turn-helix [Paenibacillus sp. OV219]
MHEGKIIRFYREKAGMTQDQLGRGICSDTHVSKIERGSTDVSLEVITLLADRLSIQIEQELHHLATIKKRLHDWHEAIILLLYDDMEVIKEELEKESLIQISDYKTLYKLLQGRYYLVHRKLGKALGIIKEMERTKSKLPHYESNLLLHITGIYHYYTQDYFKAIETLNAINEEEYNNPEYYYYLAMSYHWLESRMMAYYYSEKALRHFKDTHNFLKSIDAEMLMLLQIIYDDNRNYQAIVNRFENIIKSCDLCHAPELKRIAVHNLGFLYHENKAYELAGKYYQETMGLSEPTSTLYLLSYEGYIRSSAEGNLLSQEDVLSLAHNGLTISKEIRDEVLILRFHLLVLFIEEKQADYYSYLRMTALPLLRKQGDAFLVQRYEKELFNYYVETNQIALALEAASFFINKAKPDPKSAVAH